MKIFNKSKDHEVKIQEAQFILHIHIQVIRFVMHMVYRLQLAKLTIKIECIIIRKWKRENYLKNKGIVGRCGMSSNGGASERWL